MKKLSLVLLLLFHYNIAVPADIIIYRGMLEDKELMNENFLKIFTKKQLFWPDGSKIFVYIKPINSVEHSVFVHEWLGISTYRYKKLLKKSIFQGNIDNVNIVKSDEEMLHAINNNPGSIGYISTTIPLFNTDKLVIIYE